MKGLYSKRGWWYYQPAKPPGKPRPKAVALKTQDEVVAVNEVANRQSAEFEQREAVAGTVNDVLPIYYEARKDDAKATRIAREVILRGFSEITGNPKVASITAQTIAAWRDHLMSKGGNGLSPASVRSYTITVRAFVNWCRKKGMLRGDPGGDFAKATRVLVTRKQKFVTVDERERLLALPCGEYTRLMLYLGFFAGLRHGEMLALTPDWVWISPDGSRGTITVQATKVTGDDGRQWTWMPKDREARTIPMHTRLLAVMKDHGLRRPFLIAPDRGLWPGDEKRSTRYDAKKSLAKLAEKAGVGKLTYHVMRRSFATHLAEQGVPMTKIAALLGDSLQVTEAHYVGFAPNAANVVGVL